MKKWLLALLLFAAPAQAQTVQQSGNVTSGHAAMWATNGVIRDAGSSAQGFLTSLGITANGGNPFCINSAPITLNGLPNPYNRFCMGVGTSSAATIVLQNVNGAAAQDLQLILNGATTTIPSGSSFVTAASVLTNNGVIIGQGTNVIENIGTGTSGQCLVSAGSGSPPAFSNCSSVTGSTVAGNAICAQDTMGTLVDCGVALTSFASNTILGNNLGFSAAPSALSAGDVRTLLGLAAVATSGSASDLSTGTIPSGRLTGSYTGITGVGTLTAGTWQATAVTVTFGGTGRATLTNHGVLIGAGTTAITQLTAAAAGTVLTGQGAAADPSFSATPTLGIAGTTLGTIALAGNTSGTVTVRPAAAAGTWILTLPPSGGSNTFVLSTDGSGTTSWVANGSGSGIVNSGTAGQMTYYAGTGTTVSGNANVTVSAGAVTHGIAGSVLGQLLLTGNTSGTVTIQPQAAAGTFNFNLPITAGTANTPLLSGGGGATAMSWGARSGSTTTFATTTGTLTAGDCVSIDGSGNLVAAGGACTTGGGGGTVSSATAGQITYYASTGTTVAGNANITVVAGALTLGVATTTIGQLKLSGNTSGTITVTPQAVAGTYNFNLPTAAGTAGQPLLSGGGGASAQTYGTLGVAGGGTGQVTLTNHGVLVGAGTSAVTQLAVAAAGTVFTGVAASDPAFSSTPTLGIAGTTLGTLSFAGNTSGVVTVQPAAAAGTWSLTLPTSAGSNLQFLQTDGTGITTWATGGGGSSGITVNAQTGTTYTFVAGDVGKIVTFANAAAVAVTLPQATGSFGASSVIYTENIGPGAVTITPTTSTIDGATTLVLGTNQGVILISDGTNYTTMRGVGGSLLQTPINAQTGTTYTVLSTDVGKIVTFSNVAAIAVTLPQATGLFGAGRTFMFQNKGTGGIATITPTTSTIDGAATLVLPPNTGAMVFSDGTNYTTMRGIGSLWSATTVNAQVGTSYTMLLTDIGKITTFSNASAIAVTLPQATGTFGAGSTLLLENKGAGTVTVTPTTSTIDGATTVTLVTNQGIILFSDGTNYTSFRGTGSASTLAPLVVSVGGTGINTAAVPYGYGSPINLQINATVAANALTVALKTNGGNDPSTASPIYIPFRSVTATSGAIVWRSITAASAGVTSVVAPATATLGASNSIPFRIWVVMFDNGGTPALGVFNCSASGAIYPLAEYQLKSSTAISTAADNANVFYTTSAVTTRAYKILGYLDWNTGLTTAGTWSAAPSIIQLYGPGVPKCGDVVQYLSNSMSNNCESTTTSVTFLQVNSTCPSTKWDVTMTPTSSINGIVASVEGEIGMVAASNGRWGRAQLYRTTPSNVPLGQECSVYSGISGGTNYPWPIAPCARSAFDTPNAATAQTYSVFIASSNTDSTVKWNSQDVGVQPGATMTLMEVMR